MKERLLISKDTPAGAAGTDQDNQMLEVHHTPVGTVVKVSVASF